MGPIPRLALSLTTATRLLVISPHPDDGALAAAGLMARTVARGGVVRVVQMTSGDAFSEGVKRVDHTGQPTASDYRAYGLRRERETVAALGTVGVRPEDITSLGFPDDGLCLLTSRYMSTDFESPYTHRTSPPSREQRLKGVEYRGRDVVRELEEIIVSYAPTIVIVPDPGDEHPDHCSTHRFVAAALALARRHHPSIHPRELHYLIHFGEWPTTTAVVNHAELQPPLRFRASAGWRTLRLTDREAAAKRRALDAYRTQTMVIGAFMRGFENDNELFIEGEPAAPPPCWCAGENIAPPS